MRVLKAFFLFWVIISSVFCCALVSLFSSRRIRRRLVSECVAYHSGLALRIIGVRCSLETKGGGDQNMPYLIVANHLSYLDVLVLAHLMPAVFITSIEVRNTPIIGRIAEMGGALFVERRKRMQIRDEISSISNVLKTMNVVVFPEATSTNGESVLPFKNALFSCVAEAKRPVLPICIRYERINEELVTERNRDIVCYYGEMEFWSHFWKLLGARSIDVRIKILAPIVVEGEEPQRHRLAERARTEILAAYA